MNQNIIEHYNNPVNFLSLKKFKIPFLVDNGLIFNKEQVYMNKLEKGISINKKQEGSYIYWYSNGQKFLEENWKNGKRDGYWISWYKNGQLDANNSRVAIKKTEGNYKNGKQDGFCISYYNNGKLPQQETKMLEENYKNGKLEGLWIYWYENGNKILEGNYKDGKLNAGNSRVAIKEGL